MNRNGTHRKPLAFLLALIVGVTFVPILGNTAYAQETATENTALAEADAAAAPNTGLEDITAANDTAAADETATEDDAAAEDPAALKGTADTVDIDTPPQSYMPEPDSAVLNDASLDAGFNFVDKGTMFTWKNQYSGLAHIKVSVSGGKTFGNLQVDSTLLLASFNGKKSSIDLDIDLSSCSIGYHYIFLEVYDKNKNVVEVWYVQDVPVTIPDKPTYTGVFNVYSKSLSIYPYNMAGANAAYKLYLEYSSNGGKSWQRSGYMQRNSITLYIDQGFSISGLKANKKYLTRLRYGTTASKTDGSTGLLLGPPLNTGTKKTGKAKKPAIKSVKVKAIKVKYHKNKVPGHYEWVGNSLIWIGPYTEKYYTCKYKVTIKLKKKPGTKGIYVNGKYLKGNKKKYTVKFTPYPNYFVKKPPKGQKFKVTIKSYQAKSYGGFSPAYSKKKKVKR
ncbi:MAG: hypothetical protein IJ128_00995 [Firmicutes bacterium]|nr:hypothetical protein [Bacillota bacterium]